MKIGVILPANTLHAPYLNYYTNILKKEEIEFDVIYWNKIGLEKEDNTSVFNYRCDYSSNKVRKLIGYYLFSRFVVKEVKEKKYDKLIVLVPQIALYLEHFLRKEYKEKYILDIRDASILNRLEWKLKSVIKNSELTVISSEGYKIWLPKIKEFIVSHNIDLNRLKDYEFSKPELQEQNKIIISNIGSIRHFNENKKVIEQLGNRESFDLRYIGTGVCEKEIENYCKETNIYNVTFYGRYEKEEELSFYSGSNLINLIMPKDEIGPQTSMANRIYNACITKRPVIVAKGTYMAEIVETYNLGLIVDIDKDDLQKEIFIYVNDFDFKVFLEGCNKFLEVVKGEEEIFGDKVKCFLEKRII